MVVGLAVSAVTVSAPPARVTAFHTPPAAVLRNIASLVKLFVSAAIQVLSALSANPTTARTLVF